MTAGLVTIPARRGKAARVRQGQHVRVISTHGTQVVDTWAFSAEDPTEWMSMEASRAWFLKLRAAVGDSFLTNRRRTILTLVEDTSGGAHDMLMAACDEGPGAPEFRDMLKSAPPAGEFLRSIENRDVIVDQWQLEKLAMVTRRAEMLYYVPGLPAEFYPTLWGTAYDDPASALDALTAGLPPGATIAVIPEGPYVLAKAADYATSTTS